MNVGIAGAPPRRDLRLIGVTDLHASLYPYDYFRDRPDESLGLAQTAALIAEARGECLNCLLFENGDILQGTPLGDFAAENMAKDRAGRHPVIVVMNTLDYAAATLGNHEFNYGLDILERPTRPRGFQSPAPTSAGRTERPGSPLRSSSSGCSPTMAERSGR